MPRPLLVSFVVPVLNDAGRLRSCLASVAANGPGLEVIVVDNGSGDGSVRVAKEAGALVLERPGVSVAALRNAGAQAAKGDVLAFVDADHEIAGTWATAARLALTDTGAAATGAPYLNAGRTWVQRTYHGLRQPVTARQSVTWLGSGNLAVRREAFVSVGGFDERLRTCEDVDFCRRLRAAGGTIVADPGLMSVHAGDPATLGAVFLGELWRGRDNLRVSFRRPLDMKGIVTALVPAAALTAAGVCALAVVTGAWTIAIAAAVVAVAPVGPRTLQLCIHLHRWSPRAVLEAKLVAAAYEAGRALGLVARAGYAARRGAPAPRAGGVQP